MRCQQIEQAVGRDHELLSLVFGMVASFELEGETGAGQLTVPLAAIIRSKTRPDGYALFVIEDQGGRAHARLREVTLGEMVAAGVAVTGGLKAGDRVIVTGATIVTDGEAVEVLR